MDEWAEQEDDYYVSVDFDFDFDACFPIDISFEYLNIWLALSKDIKLVRKVQPLSLRRVVYGRCPSQQERVEARKPTPTEQAWYYCY